MQLDLLHTRDLIVALGLPQAHLRDPELRQADVRHRRQQPTRLRRVSQPAHAIGILSVNSPYENIKEIVESIWSILAVFSLGIIY